MNRSITGPTTLLVLWAALVQAQDPAAPNAVEPLPVQGGVVENACPEALGDSQYFGDAHGYNLNRNRGKHAPNHWGLAYGSGYPDGILNYGHPPLPRDWKGPGLGCRTCANGQCLYRYYGCPDLFYNYYAWPSCTNVGAQLYVSPLPVPEYVGHTYITYQPLMPHEFLYEHHRTYHRYYNGGQGLNRTCVKYWHSPCHLPFVW